MSGFHFSLLPHYVGGSTKQARDIWIRTNLVVGEVGGVLAEKSVVARANSYSSSSQEFSPAPLTSICFPGGVICAGFCSNPDSEEQESGSEFRNVQEHDHGIVTPFSVMLENQNQAAQKLERDQEWRLGCWVLWIEVCLEVNSFFFFFLVPLLTVSYIE